MKKLFTVFLLFTLLSGVQIAFAEKTIVWSNGEYKRYKGSDVLIRNDKNDYKDKAEEREKDLKNKDQEKDDRGNENDDKSQDLNRHNRFDSSKRDKEKNDRRDKEKDDRRDKEKDDKWQDANHDRKFYPNKNKEIKVTDGNYKIIKPDGTFIVNGKELGRGRWYAEDRYAVLVKDWGDLWWVGILVPGGMNAVAVEKESQIMTVTSQHFEENY